MLFPLSLNTVSLLGAETLRLFQLQVNLQLKQPKGVNTEKTVIFCKPCARTTSLASMLIKSNTKSCSASIAKDL